ncbi:MAG: hypothetical protein ACJ73D_08015 [Pyrinomonadaceae bacterium]
MHCPSCGQQQISNETKFCSRCGMPLSLVAEVVANGGFLPQLAELETKKTFLNKKNGVIATIFFMITFMMLLPALFGIADLETAAGVSAVLGVFGGMMMIIASLVFLPSSRKRMPMTQFVAPSPQQGLGGQQHGHALPPQQSIPVSSYGPPQPGNWRDTNDLQPAVTEGATRLLDDEERRQ